MDQPSLLDTPLAWAGVSGDACAACLDFNDAVTQRAGYANTLRPIQPRFGKQLTTSADHDLLWRRVRPQACTEPNGQQCAE